MYNGRRILSRHGLKDLLSDNMTSQGLYDIIHMKGEDIEIAFTHTNQYGEEYHSFVNGQHTTQGGTHQSAFKEHIARTIKEYFGKYEYGDIRNGLVAAIAINVEEPVFESQTKIKLSWAARKCRLAARASTSTWATLSRSPWTITFISTRMSLR